MCFMDSEEICLVTGMEQQAEEDELLVTSLDPFMLCVEGQELSSSATDSPPPPPPPSSSSFLFDQDTGFDSLPPVVEQDPLCALDELIRVGSVQSEGARFLSPTCDSSVLLPTTTATATATGATNISNSSSPAASSSCNNGFGFSDDASSALLPPPPLVGIQHYDPSSKQEPSSTMETMRESLYRMAVWRPVLAPLDPSLLAKPKRRNVKISKDPQTVAARHRRERISTKIRTLQRLVPGGTKMDTASMLDEAIHYVKYLKSQVHAMELLEQRGAGGTDSVARSCIPAPPAAVAAAACQLYNQQTSALTPASGGGIFWPPQPFPMDSSILGFQQQQVGY